MKLVTEEHDWRVHGLEMTSMEANMVFTIPAEFWAPEENVAELALGAEWAVFEKPNNHREHMKPLFIKGHLNGKPIGRMMVDGGTSVNIISLIVFKKLGHNTKDLKQTNLSLNGFSGEPVTSHGIVSKDLIVGNKMVPIAFFIVDIKGQYNVLLGWDWICRCFLHWQEHGCQYHPF
jgi:hypothetical protein